MEKAYIEANKWNDLKIALKKQIAYVEREFNRANNKFDAQTFKGAKHAYGRVLEMMDQIDKLIAELPKENK